jgi:predicted RNA-binding Zn-ribbon protein involved in translation (DUF1610 family)
MMQVFTTPSKMTRKSQHALVCIRHYCSQCGESMILRHTSTKGGIPSVWYSCSAADCKMLWQMLLI